MSDFRYCWKVREMRILDVFFRGEKIMAIRWILPVVAAGLLLSAVGFLGVRNLGKGMLSAQFENSAKTQALLVTNIVGVRQREVGAIQRFFMGSDRVTSDEFSRFVNPFSNSNENGTNDWYFEWIVRVIDNMRESYEKEHGGQGILVRGKNNELIESPRKDIYFPVEYIESNGARKGAVGLDLSANPQLRKALEKACDTANPVIVSMPDLDTSETDSYVFIFIYPVFRDTSSSVDLRRKNLRGFVAGVYSLDIVVNNVLSRIPAAGVNLKIYDVTDTDNEVLIYSGHAGDQGDTAKSSLASVLDFSPPNYVELFKTADRQWRITCVPLPGAIRERHFWPSWLTLGVGFLLTGLVAARIHTLKKRSRKVESLVRKRTEELDESRMRLQLALTGADLGPWDWYIETGDLVLSDRLAEMMGYSLSEIEPKMDLVRELIHPEDMHKVKADIKAHLKGLTPGFEVELRLKHTSGGWVWVLNRGRVVERDSEGWALRACGTILDITERKQVQQSRELLAAAVEQVEESIVITDTEGLIQYVNPAYEQITEYSRKEVVGKRDQVFSDTRQNEEIGVPETVGSGKTWSGVRVEEKKSGTLFYENVVVSPVFDCQGRIANYVCVKHDLTEQRRLEAEREQLEMKFRQAQKMESLGRLAGGVAHDLNNLLGPILGYSELVEKTMNPPRKIREAVEKIYYAGERARDVVSQLLAFGRQQRLSLSVLDIGMVIKRFKPLLRRTLREDVRLECRLPNAPLWIRADIGQVEQILMNLAVNAQDAMPQGGGLTISVSEVAAKEAFPEAGGEEACVLLTFSDTGTGMDEKVLNNLFEPFFTTKGIGEGTGLGLSMVYGTVKQHGGAIRVNSSPGKGSSFYIYFPITKPEAASVSFQQMDAAKNGNETVMLVEDDDGVRELIKSILTQKGYRVFAAENGRECLEMLAKQGNDVNLMLTDIVMPGMNGKDLYTKSAEIYPDMKVIYMSGYSNDVIASHGAFSKGVHFIQKPFSIEGISAKVRHVLDGSS